MKVKVAFSGSGFRLPAHIGAIRAILEQGHEIVEAAGTSGGSIAAALFACGMSVTDMENLALTLDWSKLLKFEPINGLWKSKAYCSGDGLLSFLTKYTKGRCFRDVETKLRIIASNLATEKEVEFSQDTDPGMSIALAARASASIPFVYAPVSYKGMVLVDGGVCDNIPLTHLSKGGQRIGIYLTTGVTARPILDSLDMLERAVDLILASNEQAHMAEVSDALVVKVDTGMAGSLDTNMSGVMRSALIEFGYQTTLAALKRLKT